MTQHHRMVWKNNRDLGLLPSEIQKKTGILDCFRRRSKRKPASWIASIGHPKENWNLWVLPSEFQRETGILDCFHGKSQRKPGSWGASIGNPKEN
eukprot:2937743-Pyramimonas_sp.AAC.1